MNKSQAFLLNSVYTFRYCQKLKEKYMKKTFSIIAVIFVIMGFGMIHGSYKNAEIYGGSLIGIGSLYLLIILYISKKKIEE